jgi:hypothetical protein
MSFLGYGVVTPVVATIVRSSSALAYASGPPGMIVVRRDASRGDKLPSHGMVRAGCSPGVLIA